MSDQGPWPAQRTDWQPAYGDRWEDWQEPDEPAERRPRGRVGLLSPLRLLLFLVALIAAAIALYGMFVDQTALQMPIIITGAGLSGVTLLLLSLSLAGASAQLAVRGRMGRSLVAALLGGLCIIAAAGALAGTIVLAMLTVSA